MEPKPFPEHQVALAIDLHLTIGRAENQRIEEMPSRALDEARGDRHLPPAAALPQVRERGAFRRLTVRPEVRAKAIAGVEELGQDHQLRPGFARSPEQLIGALEVGRKVENVARHLNRGRLDLHASSPPRP